ncbi:late embryoproteinsis abundant group 1 domain-containing family protein [Hibiscus syriacus]|uniref:Late embryoproteinsis abundant group 1 domain-containing family protein n=1 Tax=Hibiscus syriacus TaxID=106335 RepID=A0A6A3CJD7_HIBSY|nr:late embryoproteinsis abundant group 1 domain-containing family protein [Hibiscus syriacus]
MRFFRRIAGLLGLAGDGGQEGLKWYAKRLRMDEDGDVADEFLDEVSPETSASIYAENEQKPFPKFRMKYSTRPANLTTQVMSHDGKCSSV